MAKRPPKPDRGLTGLPFPRWVRLLVPAAMICLLPVFTSWIGNRYQVSLEDLYAPVIFALLTAVVVTLAFWRLWKRNHLAALSGSVLAALVLASNFDDRLSKLFPVFQAFTPFSSLGDAEGTLFSIVFTIIVVVLGWLAGLGIAKLVERWGWIPRDAYMAIVIAIAATFGFQLLTVTADLAGEWPQFFYRPAKISAASTGARPEGNPDIYYIVMEDYANNDVLKSQFGFDNAEFTDFLKRKGYYVNADGHQNYPYTTMSVASTLSAGYLNEIVSHFSKSHPQTIIPFHETVRSAPVAQLLQSLGYKYSLIGSWYETTNLSRVADTTYAQNGVLTVLGQKFVLNNFSKLLMLGSMFGRFMQMGVQVGSFHILGYDNLGDVDMDHYALGTLKTLAQEPAGGRFIFAHILLPHEPLYFNADGSLSNNIDRDNVGAPVKVKYVNQVKYVNGQIEDALQKIEDTSHGQAIVILQSDEGPRPLGLNEDEDSTTEENEIQAGDMRKWSDRNIETKYGAMAAYKLPGVDMSAHTEELDSANVFRLVLNNYFGYSVPYLPDCYYAYPDGRNRPLDFASITSRVTGQPEDPRCGADGSVKM
jgi:hypothetical protein